MDLTQLLQWFITSVLGGVSVKVIDLFADNFRQGQRRTEEKVNKLITYLNEFGELTSLYRFLGRKVRSLKVDEKGMPAKDESGKLIIEERSFEPEPRFEQAIEALQGKDIKSAIAQKIAKIRLMSGEALDLADELDKTGELKKRIGMLFWKTTSVIELAIKGKNFQQLIDALAEADKTRKEIRLILQTHFR